MRNVLLALVFLTACSKKEEKPAQPMPPAVAETHAHDHHHAKPAAYVCPMHPEVTSDAPGKCPKCKMDLVPTAKLAPPTVAVTTTPQKPKAGEKARLVFEMKDAGTRLTAFDVVHEKQLHLLMVTPDLAWFAHEHPDIQPDGTFALDFTFPAGGTYRLFTDFKATGRAGSVVPVDVAVDGAPAAAAPLTASNLAEPRAVGDYKVRITTPPPAVGDSATVKFLITKDTKPVRDLEPYLGALGHLVIIHEDGETFLHSHPEDHHGEHPLPSTGEVAFATQFPKPGKYKAWGQFLHKGQNIIADFVLDVRPPS